MSPSTFPFEIRHITPFPPFFLLYFLFPLTANEQRTKWRNSCKPGNTHSICINTKHFICEYKRAVKIFNPFDCLISHVFVKAFEMYILALMAWIKTELWIHPPEHLQFSHIFDWKLTHLVASNTETKILLPFCDDNLTLSFIMAIKAYKHSRSLKPTKWQHRYSKPPKIT